MEHHRKVHAARGWRFFLLLVVPTLIFLLSLPGGLYSERIADEPQNVTGILASFTGRHTLPGGTPIGSVVRELFAILVGRTLNISLVDLCFRDAGSALELQTDAGAIAGASGFGWAIALNGRPAFVLRPGEARCAPLLEGTVVEYSWALAVEPAVLEGRTVTGARLTPAISTYSRLSRLKYAGLWLFIIVLWGGVVLSLHKICKTIWHGFG